VSLVGENSKKDESLTFAHILRDQKNILDFQIASISLKYRDREEEEEAIIKQIKITNKEEDRLRDIIVYELQFELLDCTFPQNGKRLRIDVPKELVSGKKLKRPNYKMVMDRHYPPTAEFKSVGEDGLPKVGAIVRASDTVATLMNIGTGRCPKRVPIKMDLKGVPRKLKFIVKKRDLQYPVLTIHLESDTRGIRTGTKLCVGEQGQKSTIVVAKTSELPYLVVKQKDEEDSIITPDVFMHPSSILGRSTPILMVEQIVGNLCMKLDCDCFANADAHGKVTFMKTINEEKKMTTPVSIEDLVVKPEGGGKTKKLCNIFHAAFASPSLDEITITKLVESVFKPRTAYCSVTGDVISETAYCGPVNVHRLKQSSGLGAEDNLKTCSWKHQSSTVDSIYKLQPNNGIKIGFDEVWALAGAGAAFLLKGVRDVDARVIHECPRCQVAIGSLLPNQKCPFCSERSTKRYRVCQDHVMRSQLLAVAGPVNGCVISKCAPERKVKRKFNAIEDTKQQHRTDRTYDYRIGTFSDRYKKAMRITEEDLRGEQQEQQEQEQEEEEQEEEEEEEGGHCDFPATFSKYMRMFKKHMET
jgi:hypothetical protein